MKGILFKEDLFKEVIEGRKTVTRRIGGLDFVNTDPDNSEFEGMVQDPDFCKTNKSGETISLKNGDPKLFTFNGYMGRFYVPDSEYEYYYFKPRYQPEEIVYLKEPYAICNYEDKKEVIEYKYAPSTVLESSDYKWTNKLFMPQKYARYFVKITQVTAERLLDITEEEAKREGVKPDRFVGYGCIGKTSYREGFIKKWIDINGPDLLKSNPFVWAYSLEITNYSMNEK